MFGKSTFGSAGGFGQQQQQQPASVFGQQPQQQQPSAFGGFGATSTPSAFGATPAATSNAFGQPPQSAFGAAPAAGGFGVTGSTFGQARPSAFGNPAPSAFGPTQPAVNTGFGGFGPTPSASAFGSTTTQTTGGLFGQRQPAPNAFGSVTPTTNTFGQPQQTSAFGNGASTPFGQQATGNVINQGTTTLDFSPTQDRDITTGVNNFFQTITAMPQYKNYSLEELRLQDYSQGRKTAVGGGGAFGGAAPTTSAFGGGGAAPGGGSFGGASTTSAFGQPQQSAFGQPAAAPSGNAFGGGLFGQQQPATTSAFGQPAVAPGSGGFGATTSAFGQPGGFGQPAATGGPFGAGAASKPFAFGSTPAPAAGGFGTGATSTFGQQQPAAGAFGQPAAQQQQTGGFGGFGAKPAGAPATGGFGGFGQPAATGGGFGATAGGFGAAASKPATSFAFGAAAPAPTTGFGGGFGAAAPAPTASGFGQPAGGGGLFGAAKPAAPTTSLFGNTTGATTGGFGGGGFGQPAQQQQQQTGGLFGQKPATTGGGGLFGGNTNTNTFGNATTGFGGGFGNQQQQGGTFNLPAQGGLTGFGTNPLQQQQPLIATVDKNPYGNNPLFDLSKHQTIGARPSAVALDGSSRKSSGPNYPISPRVVSKIKLRGFSFPTAASKSGLKKSVSSTIGSSLDGISDDAVLGAGAFAPRTGNKRLVFDHNVDTANIVALVNDKKKTDKRRVMFDPNLELIATKKNNTSSASTETFSTTTITTTTTTAAAVTTTPIAGASTTSTTNAASASSVAIKTGYYISPTFETLSAMSKENLKKVDNLIVGRKGFGEVKFEGSVDLSQLILDDIMGNIVVIEDKKVVVYPKEDAKPPQGTQLNIPALVKIENCYSHDKNTGAAIKDAQHPRFQLFKDKLRKRSNVEFVNYEDATGAWTFKVTEF